MQKFPDCHLFAQDVSLMFVQQVSEMGRTLSMREQGSGLLNFLSGASSGNLKVGWNLLQVGGVASAGDVCIRIVCRDHRSLSKFH